MIKKVFCEFEFLKDFLKSFPNPMDNLEGAISWKRMYDFLYNAYKYIDVSNAKILEEATNNRQLLQLVKNGNFRYLPDFPNLHDPSMIVFDSEKKNSIYLSQLSKKQKKQISSEYGIIIIGKDDILNYSKLFGKIHKAIGKNSEKRWSDLINDDMKTANALILSDNYILSDTKIIDENIVCLLDKLLPYTCKFCFPIFIYTYDMKNDEKGRYKLLKEKIESIRPALDFKLTICKVYKDDFHDRNLITNNIYIECGSGFNLISNGISSKRTNLRISYPFMTYEDGKDSEMESYVNLISDIIAVEKKEHTYNVDFWGDDKRENDLIQYYKKELSK